MQCGDSTCNSDPLGSPVQRGTTLCSTQMGTQPFIMQYSFISFRIQHFFISFQIQYLFSFSQYMLDNYDFWILSVIIYYLHLQISLYSIIYQHTGQLSAYSTVISMHYGLSICSTASSLCISSLYYLYSPPRGQIYYHSLRPQVSHSLYLMYVQIKSFHQSERRRSRSLRFQVQNP